MKRIIAGKFILFVAAMICLLSCKNSANKNDINESTILSTSLHDLTDVIIHDIFSPPVASRIYAYTSLAYYEGVKYEDKNAVSIIEKLHGFDKIPVPDKNKSYDFTLVAVTAYYNVGHKLVFSKDSLKKKQQLLLKQYEQSLPEDKFENSVQLGTAIADIIIKRSESDNYLKSRGMPRFSVFKTKGKWQQTSPDYSDAVEPFWSSIAPLLLDSAAQFKPLPPPEYDLDKQSIYYKELMEVYNANKNLTPQQDTIATFWDDNSYVTQHEGHLMYANKKTTPVGHWMGITSILCGQEKVANIISARIYALTACAIFDAFIACWDEKYRSGTVRPITVIQEEIEAEWDSFLQTPPFPEYTSGHSIISSAAAAILTRYLGDNIAFTDTTEMEYLGLKRSFTSIKQAANEAGISRLYGGIHFRSAITQGSWQGERIGELYNATFKD